MAFAIARRTFGQVIDKVALAVGKRYTAEFTADGAPTIAGDELTDAKQIINIAQRKAQNLIGLEKLREKFVVGIDAPITSSTVTFTNGDATVTAAAAIFSTTRDAGRYIRDSNGVWFKIASVTDTTNVELEIDYPYATEAGVGTEVYTLFHKIGIAGAKKLRTFESVLWPDKVSPLLLVDMREIVNADPTFQRVGGTPSSAARVEHDGSTCICLHPVPNAAGAFEFWGVRECLLLSADGDVSLLPEEYHPLWQSFACWLFCMEHGSEQQIARQKAVLDTELDDLGLAENPEVEMLMVYGDSSRDSDSLDNMHQYGVSVDS